jgi:YbbR domain-containing protein
MFHIPDELEILGVDPPRLELKWENVVTRQVPLQSSLTGKPADGHVIRSEPLVDPPVITVKGAETKVETIQYVRLAPYDVTGLSEGRYPRRLAIDAPPQFVRFLGTQAATVTVEVTRRRSEKVFARRPVEVIGPAQASIIPRTVDVTVMGPPEIVRALRDDQIVPQADLEASGKWTALHGSATIPVVVRVNGAQAETQPPSVTVKW